MRRDCPAAGAAVTPTGCTALPWVENSKGQASACLKARRQDKGQEMGKKKTCLLMTVCWDRSWSLQSRQVSCALPWKADELPRRTQWWWLGPVPTIPGSAHGVAGGCCLSQPSFEPLGEVQLFSSCTSLSWSAFSSFLQSCPVQQASQG